MIHGQHPPEIPDRRIGQRKFQRAAKIFPPVIPLLSVLIPPPAGATRIGPEATTGKNPPCRTDTTIWTRNAPIPLPPRCRPASSESTKEKSGRRSIHRTTLWGCTHEDKDVCRRSTVVVPGAVHLSAIGGPNTRKQPMRQPTHNQNTQPFPQRLDCGLAYPTPASRDPEPVQHHAIA